MQRIRLGTLASAAGSTQSLMPEDLVEISISTGLSGDEPIIQQRRVDKDGSLQAPYVGLVPVAGFEPASAAKAITDAAIERGVYVQPQVSVTLVQAATNRITVLGAVGEPGVKELPRGASDVLSAIASAGGLSEEAGAVVEVLRSSAKTLASTDLGSEEVQQASYTGDVNQTSSSVQAELIDLGQPAAVDSDRLRLSDRDVIVVRSKEQRVVHVSGLVNSPSQFELMHEHDLRVLDAIAMAGGVSSPIADKVLVIRQLDREQPMVVEVSIARAKTDGQENLILQAGDLVSVESTAATMALDTFKNLFRMTMGVGGNLTLF